MNYDKEIETTPMSRHKKNTTKIAQKQWKKQPKMQNKYIDATQEKYIKKKTQYKSPNLLKRCLEVTLNVIKVFLSVSKLNHFKIKHTLYFFS